ncbi:MAG: phenylalanine--tRNA ligase subunit beta [Candidatus Woesearchaeota archaeon]
MPTISFTNKQLRKYLTKQLTNTELQETITMLGTDIEAFGEEIKVEIFPNRPDLLSPAGLARAINAFIEQPHKHTYTTKKSSFTVTIDKSVENVRAHTRCFVAKNLSLDEETLQEIIDLQEKLHLTYGRNRKKVAIGVYPLENIQEPILYSAKNVRQVHFRPLGEKKELNAQEILEQTTTGKKYGHLLAGQKTVPLFTDANNTVLSMPPIINSQEAGEVTTNTKEVFVEVSGQQEQALTGAINILACAFIDLGAQIHEVHINYPDKTIISPDLRPREHHIDIEYCLQRSGLGRSDFRKGLQKMGLHLREDTVSVEAYRTDIQHDVDFVEDALIGYGYNNIQASIPELYTVGAYSKQTLHEEHLREILCGFRLQEVMTYTLAQEGVALANPLTQEYSHLRSTILPNLLGVLENNLSRSYPQNIFEIGVVFRKDKTQETGIHEETRTSILLCSQEANYTLIRQIIEAIASTMQYTIRFSEHEDKRFIPGRCAKISGDLQGIIGEIHPQELANKGIMQPTSACEFYKK